MAAAGSVFISPSSLQSVSNNPATPVIPYFSGFSCSNIRNAKRVRLEEKCKADQSLQPGAHPQGYHLLQLIQEKKVEGWRCSKIVSTQYHYCGKFATTEGLVANSIEMAEDVPFLSCLAWQNDRTISEYGETHPFPKSGHLTVWTVKIGAAIYKEKEIICEGESARIKGKIYSSVLEYVQTKYRILPRLVRISKENGVKIVEDHLLLPQACLASMGHCMVQEGTYIWTASHPKDMCWMSRMKEIQGTLTADRRFINGPQRITFKVQKEPDHAHAACGFQLFPTNHPTLFVTDLKTPVQHLPVTPRSLVDVGLYISSSDEYLSLLLEHLANELEAANINSLCRTMAQSLSLIHI